MNQEYFVITRTQKLTFVSIDELFEYVNTHDDVIEGFVGTR